MAKCTPRIVLKNRYNSDPIFRVVTIFMIHVLEVAPGEYELDWQGVFQQRPVTVTAANHPGSSQGVQLGANQVASGRFSGLQPGRRYYFQFDDNDGSIAIAAQRGIPVEGSVNFRDFGGYRTMDGRVTKWGRFFRSGHLSEISNAEQKYLAQLDINTVCDFRRQAEMESERSLLPGDPTIHQVEIVPGARDPNHIHQLLATATTPKDVFNEMVEIMRILITEAAPHYRRLFEIMLGHEQGALLINCSAGKERTGVGAALVLMALGIPRDVIEQEFMLSKEYYPVHREIPRVLEKYNVALPGEDGVKLVMPLLETHSAYIRVVFEEIDKGFDSDQEFIKATYGLTDNDLATLREKYTEKF